MTKPPSEDDLDLLSEEDLLALYKEATGDDPAFHTRWDRNYIAKDMRGVVGASTEKRAVKVIEYWGNDKDLGAGTDLRTVRKIRELADALVRKNKIMAANKRNAGKNVFLGGSCNPTTWRKDEAVPMLTAAGVSFYNPQVDDWAPELAQVEARAKAESGVLLFVIDGQTRAIASILEATEYIASGRKVVLTVADIPDGAIIDGQAVTGRELKDLNRARAYLRELATRRGATVAPSVKKAIEHIVAL